MSDQSSNVELGLLRKQLQEAKNEPLFRKGRGGDPPHIPPMSDERIGKLEGQMEGVKHGQNIMLGGLALVAAVLIALGAYTLTKLDQTNDRIDKVSDKVNELPDKINAGLRDLTKTLSEAITASKQTPTQVIMVPNPVPPPLPPPRPNSQQ